MQNYKEYGLFDKIKAMDNLNQFTQKYVVMEVRGAAPVPPS